MRNCPVKQAFIEQTKEDALVNQFVTSKLKSDKPKSRNGGRPFVRAELGGQEIFSLVDTSATHNLFDIQMARFQPIHVG